MAGYGEAQRTGQQQWRSNGARSRKAVARQKRASLICYICGQPIDLAIKTPDPMSFELDHIDPLRNGGDVFDPSNHASSHRRCNRTKSDGPIDGTKQVPTSRRWL